MGEDALIWDGVTERKTLTEDALLVRDRLADAARSGPWAEVFAVLDAHPELVNSARLGGASGFAPLHQAAHRDASPDVVDALVRRSAWRTLRDARGERPVDVARRCGHAELSSRLAPHVVTPVSEVALGALETHFQALVRERQGELVREHRLRLPVLAPLTELALGRRLWFAIPSMYGGFVYWLERGGAEPRLVTESWSRVVEGSGARHAVTEDGAVLLAEGFV